MKQSAEFYIGYQPQAPARLRAALRRMTIALLCLAAVLALLMVAGQKRFADSTFEFGQVRMITGVVREHPYPELELPSGQQALLVAPGKHGAGELVRGLDGSTVNLSASRIYRASNQMLEIQPGSVRLLGRGISASVSPAFGERISVIGEIVDSKCHLGVMNPGEGKVHRACAARCLSGGIPPAFLARDEKGHSELFLLTGEHGEPLRRELLDYIAEPVRVTGSVVHHGSLLELRLTDLQRATH